MNVNDFYLETKVNPTFLSAWRLVVRVPVEMENIQSCLSELDM